MLNQKINALDAMALVTGLPIVLLASITTCKIVKNWQTVKMKLISKVKI
jgi:hypothetical protein